METLPLALYNLSHSGATLGSSDLPTYRSTMSDVSSSRISNSDYMLQPYFGIPQASYSQISLIDVLFMTKVERIANFSDKYILVGESGTHINDSKVSPVTGTQMD